MPNSEASHESPTDSVSSSVDLLEEGSEPVTAVSRLKKVIKLTAWPIGFVLIISAAIWGVSAESLELLRTHVQWWQLPLWIIALLTNLTTTGLLFWRMNRLFEDPDLPIPAWLMIVMIAASNLLNYLPLPKAGLMARAVYLKKRFHISYKATAGVFGMMILHAGCMLVFLASAMLAFPIASHLGFHEAWVVAGGLIFYLITQLALLPLIKIRLGSPSWGHAFKELIWWTGLRCVDLSSLLFQVWLAFHWLGINLSPGRLVGIVAARSVMALSGITPNGIGLTEWAGSWLASSEVLGQNETSLKIAISAMLLYQVMAMLVFIPIGAGSLWWLKRDMKRWVS